MNPIYKFTISANGGMEHPVFPVYKDTLAMDIEQQTNQQYFRSKLSGKLTFVGDDFVFVKQQSFDTKFIVKIYISYNGGGLWKDYWKGQFWKTGCTFDEDSESVTVAPDTLDQYTEILAGMEKEFNLIDLAPEIVPVKLDKRPMIQMYVPGETTIACFLSGMWWEQECEAITNTSLLESDYHFALNTAKLIAELTHTGTPELPDTMISPFTGIITASGGGYTLQTEEIGHGVGWEVYIRRDSDNVVLWGGYSASAPTIPMQITLNPMVGTEATGDVDVYIYAKAVYGRYVCDVLSGGGQYTYELPSDDLVANNRNYSRVIPYQIPSTISFTDALSINPTRWGIYQPGQYYMEPDGETGYEYFPIARNTWGRVSIWFKFMANDWALEQQFRKSYTLRDAFPLSSVISVLLNQITTNVKHEATTDYSQFLYSLLNPVLSISQTLFITPKSNIISSGYDQPAQKAPITLKTIMDMLRDCFRCYWFIDNQNRFRIEHISYFMNGGAYPGTPDFPKIGRDLTNEVNIKNGKTLDYGNNTYEFDKPEMASRYEFGWMDDVSQLFEGNPIDIISGYVNPDNIEQISLSKFTSDVDYILLNPSEIAEDGFVLLAARKSGNDYKLEYVNFVYSGANHILQNGFAAFIFLQQYYFYDMPATNFKYNGNPMVAIGTKRMKRQTLKFPALYDPDVLQLIKTKLGNGQIQKISVNLSSRNANATLRYDTE